MVIVDTVIVFECDNTGKVLDYRLKTGFENGLIVKYFTEHKPNSIVTISLNASTF
jgi:hypothetical protein